MKYFKLLFFIIFIFLLAVTSFANTFDNGDNIHITNLHLIDDDLYIFGQTVTIDGEVTGDFSGFAYNISTNGKLDRSVNIFAYQYTHKGKIEGSLRTFSNKCYLYNYIGNSVLLFNNETTIGKGAVIERDATISGRVLEFEGEVGEDLIFNGESITISGEIGGDVEINAKEINIIAPTIIHGNLKYTSSNEANIDLESGVIVDGSTEWLLPDNIDKKESDKLFKNIVINFSEMLAAFILGIILIAVFPKYIESSFMQLKNRIGVSFASGILTLLVFMLSTLILLVSMFGLFFGLIMSSGDTAIIGAFLLVVSILLLPASSFISISSGIIFYCGTIIVAMFVGSLILRKKQNNEKLFNKTELLLGLFLLTLICFVPILGGLVFLIAGLTGTGAIVLGVKKCKAIIENNKPSDESPKID